MSCEVLELPSDAQEILALLAEKDGEIARLTREAERQQARLQALQEQIDLLIAKRFGRSSEKLWPISSGSSTRPRPRRPPLRNRKQSSPFRPINAFDPDESRCRKRSRESM